MNQLTPAQLRSALGPFPVADDLFQSLYEAARTRRLEPGEVLFREGEEDDVVVLVLSGTLRATVSRRGEGSAEVERLAEGEWLGGAGSRHGAAYDVVVPSWVASWPRSAFEPLLRGSPGLAESLRAKARARAWLQLERRSPIFGLLHRLGAAEPGHAVHHPAGTLIFREGEEGDAAWFVVSGKVSIFSAREAGRTLAQAAMGQCFGERALVADEPRAASVRAETDVVLLPVLRARFRELLAASTEFRTLLETVDFSYRLPQRGTALLYPDERNGRPSVERVYQLDDGRSFHSSWVPSLRAFSLVRTSPPPDPSDAVTSWKGVDAGAGDRSLSLDKEGRVSRLESRGSWTDLPWLIELVLDGGRVEAPWIDRFPVTGFVERPRAVLDEGRDEQFVCNCLGVRRDRLKGLIAAGTTSAEALCRATGCGSVCGGCIPRVEGMLGGESWLPVNVTAERQTADVSSFKLRADGAARLTWMAGQHVRLSGRINGSWVERSYTLVSPPPPPGGSGELEIAVKRERAGLFSRWLHDGDAALKEIRVSRPAGTALWTPSSGPTVCVVAGIGVTPAVAIVRAARAHAAGGGGHAPLHVHYSGRRRADMAFASELADAAAGNPHVTLTLQQTATEGRVTAQQLGELARRHVGARFILCGPPAFVEDAARAFRDAGIPRHDLFEERFGRAQGAPAARTPTIRQAYRAGAAAAVLVLGGAALPPARSHWPTGGPNTGHADLECSSCHVESPGTGRQQLQARMRFLLGTRKNDVPWQHREVGNLQCTACHEREKDTHAPHLFLEERYAEVREALAPQSCASCHHEHRERRVTQPDPGYCRACHQELSLKQDPLQPPRSPTHAELVGTGRWETCLGCHDYHGNHLRKTPERLDEAANPGRIRDYFLGGPSPYGDEVRDHARKTEKP